MKIEDISFYTINKSLQMSNDKYLLDLIDINSHLDKVNEVINKSNKGTKK